MKNHDSRRSQTIIRCNATGIVLNVFLSAAKLIIGLMIKSRAVVLDGLNGFFDIISSAVSMISTAYARDRRNREHPFGYGRLEYITSMFTTVLILCMGLYAVYGAIAALLSSDTDAPDYNTAVIILMCVSLSVKCIYGLFTRKTGKRVNSIALIMIGLDTLADAVISLAILVAIAVYRTTGLNLEPWLSILISLYLVNASLRMMHECLNNLVGKRSDPEIYKNIKRVIASEPKVQNVFNLVIHNYGEELNIGSVDISVEEEMKAVDTTKLTRRIIRRAAENGVTLSSVGVYGIDCDPESLKIWDRILRIVKTHPEFSRAYAFSYDPPPENNVFFIVVVDPSVQKKERLVTALEEELGEVFPELNIEINIALDF